ncbi:histidine ammonia-lyase [Alteribacillus persepolensis]|uniref:Histidine ammonia-lyase n=1 Tax=Alteribacillus persepolensis TaxID=568899 RepID=A0A1G8B4C7_9BACI|nr:histidine ammonia-lyase [Alteribacillus persepolensis]SDH28089.1 histidine ammonia-lyase [Alteribacillus persepolensis]
MVVLTGEDLSLTDIHKVLWNKETVAADKNSMEKVQNSRQAIEKIVEKEDVVYGITTGFGKFSDVCISKQDAEILQKNLISSHACGVGEPFPERVVNAMLLLRANALLKGYSGVRPLLIKRLIEWVNAPLYPCVPEKGSLGASGDLAPLAHLALALTGEGDVFYKGKRMAARRGLQQAGMQPVSLRAKEGLALINGTQAMTAVGVVAYIEMEQLALQAEYVAAMTIEGLRGIIDAFDDDIHQARGYQEQIAVAKRMRQLLKGSNLTTKQGELRVQDAYSLRCIPQVHGAIWQTLHYVQEKLAIEINAATDNPLVFDNGSKVISGGNFHGQPIAFAMDFLSIAASELANMSERRIERLVNPQLSDLPPFLSANPGLESGAMIMQYTAAALVSENKTLAHPASVDSIPSSANQEDHVSMGTIAARHAAAIIENTRQVIAMELICSMEAAEYRGIEKMAAATRNVLVKAREVVPAITHDRPFFRDIEAVTGWLQEQKEWKS